MGSGASPSLVAIWLCAVGPCLSHHQNQITHCAYSPWGFNSECVSGRVGAVQVRFEDGQRCGVAVTGVTRSSVSPGHGGVEAGRKDPAYAAGGMKKEREEQA